MALILGSTVPADTAKGLKLISYIILINKLLKINIKTLYLIIMTFKVMIIRFKVLILTLIVKIMTVFAYFGLIRAHNVKLHLLSVAIQAFLIKTMDVNGSKILNSPYS